MTASTTFSVPTETVEAGLLHSCTSVEQWLNLSSLTEEDFTAHREIFRFYNNHWNEYGTLPTPAVINSRFNWQPPVGEFQYWLKEMKRYSLSRKVLDVIQEGYNGIADPQVALDEMLERLSLIRSHDTNHIQSTDGSALDRLAMFDARTEAIFRSDSILGLKTGMTRLDVSKIGWMPGSLIGVYARPGVGKTWWLMWQGAINWIEGKRVLTIGPEMPSNFLNLRIDVLLGGVMGCSIDYNKLLKGDPEIRPNYEIITQAQSQTNRWWTYDSLNGNSISVNDIGGLIRLHKPDIVLVDGISLLRPRSRGQTWEQIKEICYDLKNLATISEIPIIMTHQAVNSNRGRRTESTSIVRGDDFIMPSLNDAAYGDAFVQACSDIITMCGEPSSSYINWYSFRKTRERGWDEPLPVRMAFCVDFARGKIIDLGEHGYDIPAVGQAVQRLLGTL